MKIEPKYSKRFIMNASRKGVSVQCHSADMIVKFLKMKGYTNISNLHSVTASPEGRTENYIVTGTDDDDHEKI